MSIASGIQTLFLTQFGSSAVVAAQVATERRRRAFDACAVVRGVALPGPVRSGCMIDPRLMQRAASFLLILSGVPYLVGMTTQRSVASSLKIVDAPGSLAAIALGVLMVVNRFGLRI